jgi:hypothetical protein
MRVLAIAPFFLKTIAEAVCGEGPQLSLIYMHRAMAEGRGRDAGAVKDTGRYRTVRAHGTEKKDSLLARLLGGKRSWPIDNSRT